MGTVNWDFLMDVFSVVHHHFPPLDYSSLNLVLQVPGFFILNIS